jgi:hypothetical protein
MFYGLEKGRPASGPAQPVKETVYCSTSIRLKAALNGHIQGRQERKAFPRPRGGQCPSDYGDVRPVVIGELQVAAHQGILGGKAGCPITANGNKVRFSLDDLRTLQEIPFGPSLPIAVANVEVSEN